MATTNKTNASNAVNTINKEGKMKDVSKMKKAELLELLKEKDQSLYNYAQHIEHLESRIAKAEDYFRNMKKNSPESNGNGMEIGEIKRITFDNPSGKAKGKVIVQVIDGKDKLYVTYLVLTGKKGDFNMPVDTAKFMSGAIRGKADAAVGNVYRPKGDRKAKTNA